MINNDEENPQKKSWISLGNRQFYIEDVQSIYIQNNHLIINFDYTDKQIVIYFSHKPEGYKNAKKVFDALGEMYQAYKIDLPEDADPDPDILKTCYEEHISREIQDAVKMKKNAIKKRYEQKLKKYLKEIEELKKKIPKDV